MGHTSHYARPSRMIASNATSSFVWLGLSLVLAIIIGIVVYFTFLAKKNEGKYTGFLGWLYDFLNFKKMFAEALLRIGYIIAASYITLSSFAFIGTNFLTFLMYLVIGNIIARIIYEFLLIALVICRNTNEINKKLSKDNVKDEDKK